MGTLFASVYDRFLGKVTDDMWIIAEEASYESKNLIINDLQNLLIGAIPGFEFPRKSLEYTIVAERDDETGADMSYFRSILTSEEINILAILMMENWVQRQITTIENTRMKYSGSDFKMTSQANHLAKLLSLLTEVQRQSTHLQRLYKRRKVDEKGNITSNWSIFGNQPTITTATAVPEEEEEEDISNYVYLLALKNEEED